MSGVNLPTGSTLKTCVIYMNRRGADMVTDEGERYTDLKYEKFCYSCGKPYFPKIGSYKSTKYCSKTCYYKKSAEFLKERGIYKGGYNRETHIITWLRARGETTYTAPCHWCGTLLEPNNFNLDHVIPRSECKTREEMKNMDNLVVSCKSCNTLKSSERADIFKEIIEKNGDIQTTPSKTLI